MRPSVAKPLLHDLPPDFRALVSHCANAILLETSRFDAQNSRSFLFHEPVEVLETSCGNGLKDVFDRIEGALSQGLYVAGFVAYEAGYHFVGLERGGTPSSDLLAWFGVYDDPHVFDHLTGALSGPPLPSSRHYPTYPDYRSPNTLVLTLAETEYSRAIDEIKELIAQGETYQVNFTDEVAFDAHSAAALYADLAKRQPVAYGAYLNIPGRSILSFSPELFFRTSEGTITARPMKGTTKRGLNEQEDQAQAQSLRNDTKNRAEHIMIVDLLRNDLGRICEPGSIRATDLYTVERYPTLHQMTSNVSGTLVARARPYEIFRSLFPCGSITGAPKIRTMKIIRDLENRRRGAYSGAIGMFAPDGSSTFSVAIRTLEVMGGIARMGVGGGIVADSQPAEEYKECLLKAAFLSQANRQFDLIETLLWRDGYSFQEHHLDRLASSARYFDFAFDRQFLQDELDDLSLSFAAGRSYRVRLLLDKSGHPTLQAVEFNPSVTRGFIRLAAERTDSGDVFRRHKTTLREVYDRLYAEAQAAGYDDLLFTNERGELTEGAVSNLFVYRSGTWLTPPLQCGLLPGIYRRHLLETLTNVRESVLRIEDLEVTDQLYLCNSLRGLRAVRIE